jgi:hypothetical protein
MSETKGAPKGAASVRLVKTDALAQKDGQTAANGEAAKTPAAGINKTEAVRRTLAKLGWEAKPAEMQAHIKKAYDMDMTADLISTYKGDLVRKAREAGELVPQAASRGPAVKKPAAPKPQAAATKPQSPAAPARTHGGNGNEVGDAILLEDVSTTKELLDRVGAEKLRTLIDGLAK